MVRTARPSARPLTTTSFRLTSRSENAGRELDARAELGNLKGAPLNGTHEAARERWYEVPKERNHKAGQGSQAHESDQWRLKRKDNHSATLLFLGTMCGKPPEVTSRGCLSTKARCPVQRRINHYYRHAAGTHDASDRPRPTASIWTASITACSAVRSLSRIYERHGFPGGCPLVAARRCYPGIHKDE